MKLRKTSAGNYLGYFLGHYFFIYKRPHGCYCCRIGKKGKWLKSEGYHGTYLNTLKKAKNWATFNIKEFQK